MVEKKEIISLVRSVFGEDIGNVGLADGLGTVPGWDSAGQLTLLMALESKYDLEFETSELGELVTIGSICERLSKG